MIRGIESIFSHHVQALRLQSQRVKLIAANLANADTPGFKARDIDFQQALTHATAADNVSLVKSDAQHIGVGKVNGAEVRYRVPNQPALDGNTVDSNIEKTALAEAGVRYESTLTFLGRKIEGIRAALRTS